ncbi:MAG TPA: tetratricopeptide repeat protein, partial [Vicinamibacterales bacterium]|nr:tetratricopeptide repeat protein [Vicinamibacterales bacterium]
MIPTLALLAVVAQGHEHLGQVSFPISCNAEAQQRFTRALAGLHSFYWEAGDAAFQAVASADSSCAMAHWGLAMNAWGNPFAGGPGGNAGKGAPLRRGAAFVDRALALGAPTPRERGFLAAAAALYRGADSIPNSRRLQAYSDTLARVYRDFPADPEVAIYYALSLVATAPKTDTTFARQKQAAAILNPLYRRFPQHPGLAHYIIHANDSPRLATLGLDAARRYASIAPSAPHAQHMPSHIFIRLGLWDETIAANKRAFEAGLQFSLQHNQPIAPERLHALDYMVYAYLQQGRDREARSTVDSARRLLTITNSSDAILANYNSVAMEARLPLERGDWAAAARLPVRVAELTIGSALDHFARGIGAARLGDTAQARAEIAALAATEADLRRRGDVDWAHVVAIKQLAVRAWVELAAGDTAAAVRDATTAADIEDITEKQPVTPAELLPARELLADLLLALGRYGDARAAYEETLAREPNRARSLFGAARAAELAGDVTAARKRYDDFLAQMKTGDGDR